MDHLVLRERHRKRKQKRLGIMPSHEPDDANLLWRHEVKKLRAQVLLTCLFSNSPTSTSSAYAPLPTTPSWPSSSSANDPFAVMQANEAARRRQRRRAVLRAAAWVVGLALLAGALYQCLGHVRDDWLYPPPGLSPSVLFESGLPYSSLSFELVLRQAVEDGLTDHMTLCSYDRSGYGWSEAGVHPRNISVMVDELHRMLRVAEVPTPHLLVGWSYGGIIAQLYAARYPHAVAGVVLIDTVIANQTGRIEGFAEQLTAGIVSFDIARFVQWVGAFRLAGALGLLPQDAGAPPSSLPSPLYNAVLASVTKYKFPETAYQELMAFEPSERILSSELLSLAAADSNHKPLGDLPVLSVAAVSEAMPAAERGLWIETQAGEASALTTNHRQRVVDSDHFVPWSSPASVIAAIQEALDMRPGHDLRRDHLLGQLGPSGVV
ncbi:hydrolase, alpha/beta fold domain containing protein [Acanthamoeba castellanii str. Neff]|uniref:Hydrolase, alpha/beta fold domain containing protein n=1 Tax=Acanthamoeba castellanii (strain ATCC 30010 / Neff) TaxID=1257118 RepID=L8H7N0_ACACF|nr:hydrolase, alpha/beta fold domain containing protein [Acanthamoeba castellanii str. Neff]ELR21247.1 hydrolase, alpha/beta fold domain containing protein [Acanthamoeba castellanii str. Neff]